MLSDQESETEPPADERLAEPDQLDPPDRLEAFEDHIESEVGDTSLSRARHLERASGLRQLYLKFEGGNPTGTQKDRIAYAQVLDALRHGFDTLTVATCGNYGAAMAIAAKTAGLRSIILIPEDFQTRRVAEMEAMGATIERIPGDYEEAVLRSRERAARDEIYDANPGGANVSIQLRAYAQIAYEIYDELRDAPAVVAVPVSNGTTLAGVFRGFQSLYRRGKTSRIPRFCAASSSGMNPIVQAWRQNLEECADLSPDRIRETAINEPLVNWHSIDGDLALRAIRDSAGWASAVSDRGMALMARRLRDEESLQVLPAATAGLLGLLEAHRQSPRPEDRYVALLTGRKR